MICGRARPSLPVGLTPRERLDLAPVPTFARSVRRVSALADDTFNAPFLGYSKQGQAVFKGKRPDN